MMRLLHRAAVKAKGGRSLHKHISTVCFGRTLRSLSSIIDTQEICVNCFQQRTHDRGLSKGWSIRLRKAALLSIQTGFASRQAGIDVEVIPDDDDTPDIGQDAKQDTTMEDIQDDDPAPKEESIASKRDNILLHPEAKSLEEIIGAKVVANVLVGDKNPRNFGFQGHPSYVWRIA